MESNGEYNPYIPGGFRETHQRRSLQRRLQEIVQRRKADPATISPKPGEYQVIVLPVQPDNVLEFHAAYRPKE